MSLQTFMTAVLRNWWVILGLAILAAIGSAFGVSRQAPEYRASAMVELKPSAEIKEINQTINMMNLLDKRTPINTIARKATSSSMQAQVAEKLQGQGVSLTEVKNADITADVLPSANLIQLTAKSANPEHAAAICNTLATELLDQASGRVLEMDLIDPATAPTTPIGPQTTRVIVLGLLSGLVLGIIFALLENALRSARTSRVEAGAMN
jgi:succinoglycan biosynthesis transport protein ExoP